MTRTAILLPYYNHPAGLARTLQSLCGEPEPFTLCIVDDGNAPPLLLEAADYPFLIKVIRLEQNSGIVAALNAGLHSILHDSFDFIARIDAGDCWIPGRLAAQRDFLLANPDHAWVGSWATAVNSRGQDLFTLKYPETDTSVRQFMPINSALCHPAVMMRADAVHEAGFYSPLYPAAEDYDFFWRLLSFGKGANLPAPWVRYELDDAAPSISTRRRARQLRSRLKIQMHNFNFSNPRAWWGILRTVILMSVPYGFLRAIKSRIWR